MKSTVPKRMHSDVTAENRCYNNKGIINKYSKVKNKALPIKVKDVLFHK